MDAPCEQHAKQKSRTVDSTYRFKPKLGIGADRKSSNYKHTQKQTITHLIVAETVFRGKLSDVKSDVDPVGVIDSANNNKPDTNSADSPVKADDTPCSLHEAPNLPGRFVHSMWW